jgi:DNA-binding transcriptional ArsR family regulator
MNNPKTGATDGHAHHGESSGLPMQEILSQEKAQRMAAFFGVLGDPNRWRILSALALQSMRVGDLAAAVEMSESAVSHQLRILRSMRLVRYEKQGRNVLYSLKDHHIFNLYREASEHIDEPVHD